MVGLLDALAETWPARLAQDAWSAITLPRDVYQGRVDPLSPEGIGRAASLSGLMVGAPLTPRGVLGAMERMASRSPFMYNPPVRPQRPFSADYPHGAPADAAGRLTADIEGRPLHARWVVGRRVVGGDDQAFPATEFNSLAEATTGRGPAVVPARQMGSDFGRVVLNRYTRQPQVIQLRKDMLPDTAAKVHAHELGHVIDELAGQNNPNRLRSNPSEAADWGKPFIPQALGYKGDEVGREYVVEAIRAYMADPNYLKTVAPKTAAAIREAVNAHPTLSKIIQFNALAALMGLGGLPHPSTSAPEPAQ